MEYVDKLQSGLKYMVEAGEAGRKNLAGMVSPVAGAISSISSAADDLESLPFVGGLIGQKLQRVTGAISAAQSTINNVVSTYNKAATGLTQVQDGIGKLEEQRARAVAAVDKLVTKPGTKMEVVLPTAAMAPKVTPAPETVGGHAHLMIMQFLDTKSGIQPYYFNLDTAAFDELRRSSPYRWAEQERLMRRPAQQAVGVGTEKLSIKGAIFPGVRGGLKQLERLRSFGEQLKPLLLTTGYGLVLGHWCLLNVDDEQSALLSGGAPRKQGFSLEFSRYGDDMQNV
ncbi:phage tail protein [Pseudomonas sp. 21LCFQ02]|uniref:phage tail protein n=1 Tax=Pseudomonas sp. 21LCFQ02 TaxID=2957505 RepID=UPI00209A78D7|nr:phage tail protein [Pseudomonas sp. 21LCFQ02]MCO8167878.1 phage tail protein [Pseudomonas sp. 21LCFQ02]